MRPQRHRATRKGWYPARAIPISTTGRSSRMAASRARCARLVMGWIGAKLLFPACPTVRTGGRPTCCLRGRRRAKPRKHCSISANTGSRLASSTIQTTQTLTGRRYICSRRNWEALREERRYRSLYTQCPSQPHHCKRLSRCRIRGRQHSPHHY